MAKHVLKFESVSDYAIAKHNGIEKPNVVYVYENKKTSTQPDGTYGDYEGWRLKSAREAEVGDVYLYSYTENAFGFVSQEEVSKETFDLSDVVLIGVVVIPMGFTDDGKIRIVSLNYASIESETREYGTNDLTKAAMPWGVYSPTDKTNSVSNYRYSHVPSPYIALDRTPNNCFTDGIVPMDRFFDATALADYDEKTEDLLAQYDPQTIGYNLLISPYAGVDEKNPIYHSLKKYYHTVKAQGGHGGYSTGRDTTTIYTMATAYPNGLEVTTAMKNDMLNANGMTEEIFGNLALETFTANQFTENIAEDGEEANYVEIYPAALACMAYGYGYNGNVAWYLPSLSEFIYMMTRINKINATLQVLAEKDENYTFCQIANGRHWTSTKVGLSQTDGIEAEVGTGNIFPGGGLGDTPQEHIKNFYGGWYCDTTNGEVDRCIETHTTLYEDVLNTSGNGHVSYYVRPFAMINDTSSEEALTEIHTQSGGSLTPINGGSKTNP